MKTALLEKHKKDLRKSLREEYGGKNYSRNEYESIIKVMVDKLSVNIEEVQLFMQEYTTPNKDQINILKTKKRVSKSSNEKNIVNNKDDKMNKSVIKYDMNEAELHNFNDENDTYEYPSETYYPHQYTTINYGPHSTWIYDEQFDDVLTPEEQKRTKIFEELCNIVSPVQRTTPWYEMRNNKITASDGGCVLGFNHFDFPYKFLLKKLADSPFTGAKNCYHGKKYETIATMIYKYRFNVTIKDFGLMGHKKYKFLGASPDGIIGKYKFDEQHLTKYVGRMLEIKCPVSRKFEHEGDLFSICPKYYWAQVQLQLECCDLDECDFWQCKITEYSSRDAFINDSSKKEPFRSKKYNFEKGCVIQVLPRKYMVEILQNQENYEKIVYDHAKFIYPPSVEMTPLECDMWITDILSKKDFGTKKEDEALGKDYLGDYYFDRVFYWKIQKTSCVTILRDQKWFEESLPKLERMWNYIEFFREHKPELDKLLKFINSFSKIDKKINDDIMELTDKLYCSKGNHKPVKNLFTVIDDHTPKYKKCSTREDDVEDNFSINKIDNSMFFFDN